jgi:peroxiredoxin
VGPGDRELFSHHWRALELLERPDRLDDPRVSKACRRALRYPSPATERFLRVLVEKSERHDVQGLACFCLAELLRVRRNLALEPWFDDHARSAFQRFMSSRLAPGYVQYIRATDPQAVSTDAERLYQRCIQEFGDVVYEDKGDGARALVTLDEPARESLKKLLTLTVGRIAPDIVGEDVDGKRIQLRDYRGKVVVLAFFGNWSGPSRAMYPHVRKLMERLSDKPFVFLGVNTDEDKRSLRRSIDSHEITWRCWWDRNPEGPISSGWSIESFPTFFVLDRDGVIRSKNERAERLDWAVDRLLAERETAAKP